MKPRRSLCLFALCAAVAAAGQTAGDESEAGAGSSSSGAGRAKISPRLSAAIRETLPSYESLSERTAPAREESGDEDVVVLNPIIVRERRPDKAAEWQLLTEIGRAAALKERYKGATVPGAALTEAMHNYGMQMHRDDVRSQRLSELDAIVNAARAAGDTESLKDLKDSLHEARMRPKDMRAESMDRSYNNDRR